MVVQLSAYHDMRTNYLPQPVPPTRHSDGPEISTSPAVHRRNSKKLEMWNTAAMVQHSA